MMRGPKTQPFTIAPAQAGFVKRRLRDIVERCLRESVWMDAPLMGVAMSAYCQAVCDTMQLIEQRGWPPWREEPEYMI